MLIPRAGELVGDFELIRRVGAGGMGVVYEARQCSSGRRVALKILSPAMSREKSRQRFLREAQAAARLRHPHIVPVLAIHEDAELCYYAMEFIDGVPLSRVLQQLAAGRAAGLALTEVARTAIGTTTPVDSMAETIIGGASGGTISGNQPVESSEGGGAGRPAVQTIANPAYIRQIVRMIRDVARALDYAHGEGVVHRDIKPDNLLMDESGSLHLVDFGLARVLDEDTLTMTGELMGTPLYMSPEQVAAGRIGLDHRTDLYSLGVVLYHLLCLQPPYEASTREGLLRAIAIHPAPMLSRRNPAVPRTLEAIVHHTMEKDPDRRYRTGAVMADDLDRWLAGKRISIRPPGRLRRLAGRIPRRVVGRVLVGTAVLSAFMALLLSRPGKTPDPVAAHRDRAAALATAAQAARMGDYATSGVWYSTAARLGAALNEISPLELGIALNELPPLTARLPLNAANPCWQTHPQQSRVVVSNQTGRLIAWDPLAELMIGEAFGLGLLPRWMSHVGTHFGLLAVESGPSGDAAQYWTSAGEAVLGQALTGLPRVEQVRIADGGRVVAFMAKDDHEAPEEAGEAPLQVVIYAFEPGAAPRELRRFSSLLPVELSHDGRYVGWVRADDQFELTDLRTGRSVPVGTAGTTKTFVFSPAADHLALADASGEVTLLDPRDRAVLPMQEHPSATGLRTRTAPAYMRFSPDGKWLVVVGADTQVSPPNLRSIALLRTAGGNTAFPTWGRDACFSPDGRLFCWWDNDKVHLLEINDVPRPVSVLAANVRPQPAPPAVGGFSDPGLGASLSIDAAGRRVLCLESRGERIQPSVWDTASGERLWDLLTPVRNLTAARLDATGRFAFAQAPGCGDLLVWDLGSPDAAYPRAAPLPSADPKQVGEISLSGRPLVTMLDTTGSRSDWHLVDPRNLKRVGRAISAIGIVSRSLLSADGSTLLEARPDGMVRVLDLERGMAVHSTALPSSHSGVMALSADGDRFAFVWSDRRIAVQRLREPGSQETEIDLIPERIRPARMRFSTAGRLLAVTDESGWVGVYEIEAGPVRVAEWYAGQVVREMAFFGSDLGLVLGHIGGRASVWSLADARRIGVVEPHPGVSPGVTQMTVSPFPTRLAIRERLEDEALGLLATACGNRVELWRLPTPDAPSSDTPLVSAGPPLKSSQGILDLVFPSCTPQPTAHTAPAGHGPQTCDYLLVLTERAGLRWFDLSTQPRTTAQWRCAFEQRTAMRLNDAGEPVFIPRQEWRRLSDEAVQ
jgi:serine/threonine protein kinase/WD40 repeat protein